MDASIVPVVKLDGAGDGCEAGIESIIQSFQQRFGLQPQLVVKVPGRVNIIGEHIDYCGYPVFPMAIEKNILIAVRESEDRKIHLSNTETSYPDFTCEAGDFAITQPPKWHDYFLSGVRGVSLTNADAITGMQVLVDGTIPPAAGLSSSSALVCGAAVASHIVFLKNYRIVKDEMASACAKNERLIGTAGGGMDQAIQMLADAGCAKFVEFVPKLRATSVSLPSNATFFVSHSGVSCNKAATSCFNTRVLETKIAAVLMAKKEELETVTCTLSSVQRAMTIPLFDMRSLVDECLKKEAYGVDEVLEQLDLTSTAELLQQLSLENSGRFDEALRQDLKLRDRASHVYAEVSRVDGFRRVCEDMSLDPEAQIQELGRLMNESHESLRAKYECSCMELDRLVEGCRSAGAIGSRLTGAGWGGCVLSLVHSDDADGFKARLKEIFPDDTFTFQTKPCAGTVVYLL